MVNGEKIPVSKAIYQSFRQENNRMRHFARKEQLCALVDYPKCEGVCEKCRWRMNSHQVYYSDYTQERFPVQTSIENPENEAIWNITYQKILVRADQLAKHGSLILKLRLEEGYNFREISTRLGMSINTVYKHYRRILEYFRMHKEEYF